MTEVTVISPRVVEFFGSLSPRPRRAATRPPPPAPRNNTGLKSRDPAKGGSRGLAANGNALSAPRHPPVHGQPKSRLFPQPGQPAGRPSAAFVTQLLAQKSNLGSVTAKNLDTAIAAYRRASAGQPDTAPSGTAFLVRKIDQTV